MTGRLARLVLASGSPRRHQLLRSIRVEFTAISPDIDETPAEGEEPVAYVERLAREKVAAVQAGIGDVVLAADTTVALGPQIFGKPVDADDARRMLRALSGRTHDVHTAAAVRAGDRVSSAVVTTRVTMVEFTEDDIGWYVSTGEPLDKAGAYALQEAGGLFVVSVEGSASNVIGLPLAVVSDLLTQAGFPLSRFRTAAPEPSLRPPVRAGRGSPRW
jgi:nucleoside triphosphate pyrophosphatase